MSKIMKSFLVSVLAVSMMVMGPVSAIGTPVETAPATKFSATDLTADLEDALGVTIAEVTAIGSSYSMDTLIAALDMNGNVVLAGYDGEGFYDITEPWNDYIGSDWTRVNSILCYDGDWFVGGSKDDGGGNQAALVLICGSCYYYDGGGHEWFYSSDDFIDHTAVTGLAYAYDTDMIGITTSGPAGMFTLDNPYGYDFDYDLAYVDDPAMAGATGPIATNGPTYGYGDLALGLIEPGDNTEAQNAPVYAQYGFTYWMTGTAVGDALVYGGSYNGQTYASLAGVGAVESIDYDYGYSRWFMAGQGYDGYMKLFVDSDMPVEITTGTGGPVQLDLPQTMTDSVNGVSGYPFFLVGGTGGGSGHFYKYNDIKDQFIDLDYLVDGMDAINVIEADYYSTGESVQRVSAESVFVGGSGDVKLVLVTQEPAYFDTVPSGEGADVTCPAGGAGVTIPAGAVNANYSVIVEKVASGTPNVPGGLSLLGTSYEFTCVDEFGDPITTFDAPVTITISYDEADLNGMSEDSLIIYYFDTADDTWKAVTPCVVDKVNNTVTITVNHFTQFGILGVTATAMPYTGK